MAESGKSDRWNSLLETLGVAPSESKLAEPAAETEAPHAPAAPPVEQPRAVSMLRPEKVKPAAKAKPVGKPPAKSASYWSRIAGALGLESAAVEEAPAEEPQPIPVVEPTIAEVRQTNPLDELMVVREREEVSPESHREEFSRRSEKREQGGRERTRREPGTREQGSREQGNREPRERSLERGRQERSGRREPFGRESSARETHGEERRPAGDEPAAPRPTRGGGFGSGLGVEQESRREDEDSPRMREPGMPRQREVDESGSVLDYEAPAGEGSDVSDLSFGGRAERRPVGDEEGDEAGGRRRRRRRRGRGKRGGGEAPAAGSPARHEEDIEPAGEDVDFDFEREEDLGEDSDIDSEVESRGRQGRSSRRSEGEDRPAFGARPRERDGEREAGRGGRTRRREERPARGPSRQSGDYEGEPVPRQEHAGRPMRNPAVSKVENEELDSDFDLGDEHEDHEGGNVPTHKKIPTWDEAVSVLIDANMATRGNSERDRDRGRGRGRGRR